MLNKTSAFTGFHVVTTTTGTPVPATLRKNPDECPSAFISWYMGGKLPDNWKTLWETLEKLGYKVVPADFTITI